MTELFAVLTGFFAFIFVVTLTLTLLGKHFSALVSFVTDEQLAIVSTASGLATGVCLALTFLTR